MSQAKSEAPTTTESGMSGFIRGAGTILAISYPVLALSTGVRAVYQGFFKDDVTNYLAVTLSGIAALCYLLATIGFTYRRKWAWQLSVGVLAFETLMTFVVGGLSLTNGYADAIGRTVWRQFGADYGYFPLIQPLLGLLWLFFFFMLLAYGIRRKEASVSEPG